MQLIVGVTGASGVTLAAKFLQILAEKGIETHLIISDAGNQIAREEHIELHADYLYENGDLAARIASGSYIDGGMVIIPCSMNTLGKLANGIEDNLILRAAAVHLKEKRRLVIVPRETPLSEIHIGNLLKVKRAGADILLPVLTFYHKPKTVDDFVNFIIGKLLDLLNIENTLYQRWTGCEIS